MGFHNCRHCGKEIGEEELYCPDCQALFGGWKTKKFWLIGILFSVVLVAFLGLLLADWEIGSWKVSFHSILGRKPVAVINGETITRAEFQKRLKVIRAAMEQQYGPDLFSGENGQMLLGNLEQKILDGFLEEKLIAQEARRLGIQVSNQDVEKEIQQISKEAYGTKENFLAKIRERKISDQELNNFVRNYLLYKRLKEAKSTGSDPGVFNAWLLGAKQRAQLAVYDFGQRSVIRSSLSGGGCCGSGGSSNSCMVSRPGKQLDAKTESDARKVALDAFQKEHPREQEITAKVTDYGCHIQVDIQKEGRIIKSYSYREGKVFDIS